MEINKSEDSVLITGGRGFLGKRLYRLLDESGYKKVTAVGGTQDGVDLEITRKISRAVNVPVIASGGIGTLEHFSQAIVQGEADAVLAASVFHRSILDVREIKTYLDSQEIPVRLTGDNNEL